jgi:hypothetical protein
MGAGFWFGRAQDGSIMDPGQIRMDLAGVPGFAAQCMPNSKDRGSGKHGQFLNRCVGKSWGLDFPRNAWTFFVRSEK